MCNLYSLTNRQQAIRDHAGAMRDVSGNLPLVPGISRRSDRAQRP